MYIWQKSGWPRFSWKGDDLIEPLGLVRKRQGYLQAIADEMGLKQQAMVLVEETIQTAAIEGEQLSRDSVRSSVARRLGLETAGLPPVEKHTDGLVEVLIDATQNCDQKLDAGRLKSWHAALFPTGYSGMAKITVANWRRGNDPMQVVSGPIGKERVHYQAPPSVKVAEEMRRFLAWWKSPPKGLDGLIRAAIAHFWFVTIHPFDDGNGRIARAITDMALSQDEGTNRRLYSMSSEIMKDRKNYYAELKVAQRGDSEITQWIVWFLQCLRRSIDRSCDLVGKTFAISQFWSRFADVGFNDRQRKVIGKLLEAGVDGFEGGLTNRKYIGMTKTSRETAKRDIADLVQKEVLIRNPGGGRSISYRLAFEKGQDEA